MNGHDALLAVAEGRARNLRRRGGRDGVAIGMEGNGGGRDGEWREWARKAEKGTRMKHAAPASCGGGEGRAKWTRCGEAFRLAAGRRLSA